jgi:hypothetical protein
MKALQQCKRVHVEPVAALKPDQAKETCGLKGYSNIDEAWEQCS